MRVMSSAPIVVERGVLLADSLVIAIPTGKRRIGRDAATAKPTQKRCNVTIRIFPLIHQQTELSSSGLHARRPSPRACKPEDDIREEVTLGHSN
jgi:hypothetical protein